MTRTSIDAAARRVARGERRFNRALLGVIVVLALACTGFAVVSVAQGPKVSSVRVDTTAVTQRPDQQLRIFANQAIAQLEPEQVTVDPEVPVTVGVDGDVIAITFDRALRYGTTYRVTIVGATSPYAATPSTLTAEFTTATTEGYLLDRGEPEDLVVQTTLTGERTTVFSGPRIQSFAVLPGGIVTAHLNADLTSTVTISSLDGLRSETLPLPAGTSLRGMALDPGGTILGFQLTSLVGDEVAPDTLYLVDLESGRSVLPVSGIDGLPLRALTWAFEPSGSILALTNEGMLVRIGEDDIAFPLGRVFDFGPISSDGASVIVNDSEGLRLLDLNEGTRSAFSVDGLGERIPILSSAQLQADGSAVLIAVTTAQPVTVELVVAREGAVRSVFSTTGGSIVSFSVSPNGQYAALEHVPDVSAAQPDRYGADSVATTVETVLVDLDTGEVVMTSPGFAWQW